MTDQVKELRVLALSFHFSFFKYFLFFFYSKYYICNEIIHGAIYVLRMLVMMFTLQFFEKEMQLREHNKSRSYHAMIQYFAAI